MATDNGTKEPVLETGRSTNTFDIDKELNQDVSVDYEEQRVLLKLGYWKSALLLFQGTVGLSIFTMQKPLQMVGLLWGLVITVVTGYVACYGLVHMARLASDIEADFNFKRKIKNFEELCKQINGKYVPYVKWLMMAAGICMMYASTITNILLITTTVTKTYNIGEIPIKLIIFGIITLLLVVIVEPEKIQYINVYVTTLLMLLAYLILGKNVYSGTLGDGPGIRNVKMMDIKYTGLFAGNIAYAFEVASNYLSLRLTSSNEVKYDQLTKYMIIFVGFNFYLCAAAHLIAFP